jgi:hypothetical protein
MVRTAAATISWLPLGTTARTLRMKWTRQTPTVNQPLLGVVDEGMAAGRAAVVAGGW